MHGWFMELEKAHEIFSVKNILYEGYPIDRIFFIGHILHVEFVTQILTALADPIRLRSLALIVQQGDLCVCETCYALEIAQPKASKHLATLRDAGLVKSRRDAQWTFYAVAADLPDWARAVIDAAVQGLAGDAIHAADVDRLKRMPGRPPRTADARRST